MPVSGAPASGKSAPGESGKREEGAERKWTIVLGIYSGEDHAARAAEGVAALRSRVSGLPAEPRVEQRGRGSAIVMGGYDGPGEKSAQRDLAAVRGVMSEGRPAFPGAFLAPPSARDDAGELPRYHLLRAREEFGRSVRYTLQVAVYESPDREEAKRAAEQAAAVLRREGEPAYYFHGVTQSMVTVGAYTDREAGLRDGKESAELSALRARRPLNLFNGNRQIMEGGAKGVAQGSFLVEIPEGR